MRCGQRRGPPPVRRRGAATAARPGRARRRPARSWARAAHRAAAPAWSCPTRWARARRAPRPRAYRTVGRIAARARSARMAVAHLPRAQEYLAGRRAGPPGQHRSRPGPRPPPRRARRRARRTRSRRPVGDHPAARAQHHHAVDQVQHLGDPVLDEDERGPAVGQRCADGVADEGRAGGVEVGRRLVEQQQARAAGDRAGQREPLLFAAGERGGRPVARVRRGPPRPAAASTAGQISLGRYAAVLQSKCDIVADPGHHELGLRVLEDDADLFAGRPGVDTVDGDHALLLARVLGEQAGQRGEQRALAGPRRAEQQHPLAARPPVDPRRARPRRDGRRDASRSPRSSTWVSTARRPPVAGRTGTGPGRRSGPAPASARTRRGPAITTELTAAMTHVRDPHRASSSPVPGTRRRCRTPRPRARDSAPARRPRHTPNDRYANSANASSPASASIGPWMTSVQPQCVPSATETRAATRLGEEGRPGLADDQPAQHGRQEPHAVHERAGRAAGSRRPVRSRAGPRPRTRRRRRPR